MCNNNRVFLRKCNQIGVLRSRPPVTALGLNLFEQILCEAQMIKHNNGPGKWPQPPKKKQKRSVRLEENSDK